MWFCSNAQGLNNGAMISSSYVSYALYIVNKFQFMALRQDIYSNLLYPAPILLDLHLKLSFVCFQSLSELW